MRKTIGRFAGAAAVLSVLVLALTACGGDKKAALEGLSKLEEICKGKDAEAAKKHVDELSAQNSAFTKAWDGMVYGSVGWIATDAADEAGVLWVDMAAAARVRPTGTAWWVQFGALTGFQAPREGGARGISDYLGVTLGTGLSLDADRVWDLGLVTACRFDTEVGDLLRMASPSIELRLGTSL